MSTPLNDTTIRAPGSNILICAGSRSSADRCVKLIKLTPKGRVGILHRVVVLVLFADDLSLDHARLKSRNVVLLADLKQGHIAIMAHHVVDNFPVEESVACQHKNLFNVLSFKFGSIQPDVIATHSEHFTHQSADNKERTTVHTGYRVINDDDFIFAGVDLAKVSAYFMGEIQKRYEVTFALAQVIGKKAVLADELINAFDTLLFPK